MRLDVVGRFALWLGAAAVLPRAAAALQTERPNAGGRWQFAALDRSPPPPGATVDDVRALYQKLILAAMPFRQSPALFRPKGVEVVPLLRAVPPPEAAASSSSRPLAGELRLQFFPLYADCAACWVKTGTASVTVHVWANFPEALYAGADQSPVLQDDDGPMYAAPLSKGTIDGFPDYEARSTRSRFVVVTASKRPLWLPVTQERVVQGELKKAKADLASVERGATAMASAYQEWLAGKAERKRQREEMVRQLIQQMPQEAARLRAQAKEMEAAEEQVGEQLKASEGTNQAMGDQMLAQARAGVAGLEAELAALTPQDRAKPVFIGPSGTRLPASAATQPAGSFALIAPNPEFLDPTLPKTAIQVLIVEVRRAQGEPFAGFLNRKMAEMQASLEWARLAQPLSTR